VLLVKPLAAVGDEAVVELRLGALLGGTLVHQRETKVAHNSRPVNTA
jgi:hypothetical protein